MRKIIQRGINGGINGGVETREKGWRKPREKKALNDEWLGIIVERERGD